MNRILVAGSSGDWVGYRPTASSTRWFRGSCGDIGQSTERRERRNVGDIIKNERLVGTLRDIDDKSMFASRNGITGIEQKVGGIPNLVDVFG